MFKIKGLLATAAAASLLGATTAASAANPAASLSVAAPTRAATSHAHDSRIGAAVPTTVLISIGVLAALVVIVLVAVDNGNGSSPKSP